MISKEISYQIFILKKTTKLQVGKLGIFTFPKGEYIYTGSAKRGIDKRIERHKNKNKKLHWHIDYLLDCKECSIKRIIKSKLNECSLNQSVTGNIIVNRFGSGDCSNGCRSHLKYIEITDF